MKQVISFFGVAIIIYMLLCSSCNKTKDLLPLQAMHGIIGDTLKILAKGSPPFQAYVSKGDTSIWNQTLDSIGVFVLPIADYRSNPGNYQIQVESSTNDTTFSIFIADKSAEQAFEEQEAEREKTISKNQSRTKKKNKVKTSKEWSEWARSECFRKIWYKYRLLRVNEAFGTYKYEYQVFSEYSDRVILRAALIDQDQKASLDKVKANGGSLMGKTTKYFIDYREYSGHSQVTLFTTDPYFYIWRMQKKHPVSPYVECDH